MSAPSRDGGSWWVGCSTRGFTDRCYAELERMQSSKFSTLRVPYLFEVAEERRKKKAAAQAAEEGEP